MESEPQQNTAQDAVTPVSGEQVVAETKPVESQVNEDKPSDQPIAPADQAVEDSPVCASETAVDAANESQATVEEVEMTEPSNETETAEKDKTSDQSTTVTSEPDTENLSKSSKADEVSEKDATKATVSEQMDTSAPLESETLPTFDSVAETLPSFDKPETTDTSVSENVEAAQTESTAADNSKETAPAPTEEKANESNAQPAKKQKIDYAGMAVRQYLDHTVVPILLAGLASVAKARPEDPITYLANYLTENKSQYDNNQENSSLNGNQ